MRRCWRCDGRKQRQQNIWSAAQKVIWPTAPGTGQAVKANKLVMGFGWRNASRPLLKCIRPSADQSGGCHGKEMYRFGGVANFLPRGERCVAASWPMLIESEGPELRSIRSEEISERGGQASETARWIVLWSIVTPFSNPSPE